MGVKFQPGQSGNPNGRPKGTSIKQQLFNELVVPRQKELIEKAIELAVAGNEAMLRLLLDRILPVKPIDNPIVLDEELSGTPSEKTDKVLELVTQGELTPAEGQTLMNAISAQMKIVETDDILKCVQKLELQNERKLKKTR